MTSILSAFISAIYITSTIEINFCNDWLFISLYSLFCKIKECIILTMFPPRIILCQVYRVIGLCLVRKFEKENSGPSISLILERTNKRNFHYSRPPSSDAYSKYRTRAASIFDMFSGFSLTFLCKALPRALNVMTHQGYLSKSSFKWLLFRKGFLELPTGVNSCSFGIKSPAIVGKSYILSLYFFKKVDNSAGEAEVIY